MLAGVSTACLFPKSLEESLYDLAVNGVSCVELFVNTHSELKKSFAYEIAGILKRFDMRCFSVHPFTSEMEQLMFFSDYDRRLEDSIDYYKGFFRFMNIIGAKHFVFHGAKAVKSKEFFCERYKMLYDLGKENGITVSLENVARCASGSSGFIKDAAKMLGSDFSFVLDTKQAVRSGENPFNFLNAAESAVSFVHISDHSEMGDCLPIGKGRFDINLFLKKLSGYNPDCALILELYRNGFKGISELIASYNRLESMIASH